MKKITKDLLKLVVFLKKNSRGVHFPKPVCGAIDYVENYNELMEYIETHTKSDNKADLFILNVLKPDRARIKQVCQTNGLTVQFLIGCSDMGVHAYHNMSTSQILQSLLEDGGKTAKYKLIGPRDKYGGSEDKDDKNPDRKIAAGQVQSEHSVEEEEEIVINQWIADHLVVMEVFTSCNELESTKAIISHSVRSCPDTREFIIEKKRNNAGIIFADALIDRNVVGRARGFDVQQVKFEAAENAMLNLLKCCYYIEAKKSYFGSSRDLPYFLQQPNPIPETKIYRIADIRSGSPNKILHQFRSAWQEDLYFLDDFTEAERNQIGILARKMNFLVRWIGREGYLCVYKKIKPNEVLMELLSTHSKENEKYKLIIPPSKIHQHMEERTTHQDWNNQGTYHDVQANIQPISRGQESYYIERDNVNPSKVKDRGSTLSERLQRVLEEGNRSNRQDLTDRPNKPVPSNASNKRPYDQGPDVKEECEPSGKVYKPTTYPHSSQFNSSFGRQSSKDKGEPSNHFSEGQRRELSVQKPRTWDSNVGNSGLEDWYSAGKSCDRSFTDYSSFEEEAGSKHPFGEGSSIKVEKGSGKDTSKFFDRRPESTQHSNSHWDQGTEHQRPNTSTGGQRNFTNLFDYSGPQDVEPQGFSRPMFSPRPPPPWKKNRQFKGHSFSKLAKYGKNKGPKGP